VGKPRREVPYSYRQDAGVPPFPDDLPIIVFDGHCALCSGWVQFALRHDKTGHYRFLPAQSALGAALYTHYGLHPTDYESNVLIKDGVALFESEGSLQMIAGLGLPWSLVNVVRVLPRAWLDHLYRLVARNRLNWFGRREACYLPTPETRERFLA